VNVGQVANQRSVNGPHRQFNEAAYFNLRDKQIDIGLQFAETDLDRSLPDARATHIDFVRF